jgi:hypothetical protein
MEKEIQTKGKDSAKISASGKRFRLTCHRQCANGKHNKLRYIAKKQKDGMPSCLYSTSTHLAILVGGDEDSIGSCVVYFTSPFWQPLIGWYGTM